MATASSFGLGRAAAAPAASESATIDASTPWVAAADGDLALLQSSLQSLNLPITAADENGYTLLQAAASYGHLPLLQWLVESVDAASKMAWMQAVDQEGDSALHYASTRAAAQFLMEHGADPTIRNAEGKTALESKQAELDDAMQDEDDDEDDQDMVNLREVIAYLASRNNPSQ